MNTEFLLKWKHRAPVNSYSYQQRTLVAFGVDFVFSRYRITNLAGAAKLIRFNIFKPKVTESVLCSVGFCISDSAASDRLPRTLNELLVFQYLESNIFRTRVYSLCRCMFGNQAKCDVRVHTPRFPNRQFRGKF